MARFPKKKQVTVSAVTNQQIKKVIKRERQSERKVFDRNSQQLSAGFGFFPSNVGILVNTANLTGIEQGVDKINRIGQNIELESLTIRGQVYIPDGVTADNTNYVRMIIFQWLDEPITLTAPQQVLYDYTLGGFRWDSFVNLANTKKMNILKDTKITLSINGRRTVPFQYSFKKQLTKSIKFVGLTGPPESAEIYILLLSDSTATVHPAVEWSQRLRYYDN